MTGAESVVFVDDEAHVREAGKQTLELAGFRVRDFASAEPVLAELTEDWPGAVVTDIKMPGMDGLTLMRRCLELDPGLPVILVTGHGDVSTAVQAIRDGAYDFLEKPFATDRLAEVVRRALEKRALVLENRSLRSEIEGAGERIIGDAPSIEAVRRTIRNIADTDADVLIVGETGTGKELIARHLHQQSQRHRHKFVGVNCGAIPESIIESEMFGHEPGAFTGARGRRIGKFEYAGGGTLFLDEIESMPVALQVKLLRVLQERVLERLGSNESIPVDVRVIAATKSNLKALVAAGRFREDLYYRLDVIELHVPPLRARREDVAPLFNHFVLRASARYGREPRPVPAGVMHRLTARAWPGNVRELQNVAERYVLCPDDVDLGNGAEPDDGGESSPLARRVATIEKSIIAEELSRRRGDIGATYRALGLARKTLYEKMRRYGLNRKDFR